MPPADTAATLVRASRERITLTCASREDAERRRAGFYSFRTRLLHDDALATRFPEAAIAAPLVAFSIAVGPGTRARLVLEPKELPGDER